MKGPWYCKFSNARFNKEKNTLDYTVKLNRWWVLYKKIQFIVTMQIKLKWDKGLRIILDNPKNWIANA